MRIVILPVLCLVGCDNGLNLNRRSQTDTFYQAPSNEVDILWVVDGSVSMADEVASVATSALDFTEQLASSGMDFHLGVITMDVDADNAMAGALLGNPPVITLSTPNYSAAFQTAVQVGTTGSDKERGLEAAYRAISAPLTDTRNAGFLRDTASLSVIFLTDENDCSDFGRLGGDATGEACYDDAEKLVPVVEIVELFQEIKGDMPMTLSGIVGPEILADCENTVPGQRYFTAFELTSGISADICQDDYGDIMSNLGLVASGIVDTFQLSHNADPDEIEVWIDPDGDDFDDVERVKVEASEENGWSYVTEYAQIRFHGDAVPPRGARIDVTYVIASGVVEQAPEDTGAAASSAAP